MKFNKLTNIEYEESKQFKQVNEEIENKIDDIRNELYNSYNNLDELEQSNDKFEYYKLLLIRNKHWLKDLLFYTFMTILTICMIVSPMGIDMLKCNPIVYILMLLFSSIMIGIAYYDGIRSYMLYKNIKNNFKDLGIKEN